MSKEEWKKRDLLFFGKNSKKGEDCVSNLKQEKQKD